MPQHSVTAGHCRLLVLVPLSVVLLALTSILSSDPAPPPRPVPFVRPDVSSDLTPSSSTSSSRPVAGRTGRRSKPAGPTVTDQGRFSHIVEPSAVPAAGPLPSFRPMGCPCERHYSPAAAAAAAGSSSCGETAERRGLQQSVISFSVFGSMTGPFFRGVARNAELAGRLYPGWVMRVYHDYNVSEPEPRDRLCNLTCSYAILDFCDVHQLPELGNISGQVGRVWRFAAMSDLTVRRFLMRDVDSLLSQRERDAVDAWLASNLTFHVMRDHPYHGTEMLAGMWGGWNRHSDIYRPIRQQLLQYNRTRVKTSDQRALRELLWPEMQQRQDVLVHDSYTCRRFPLSSPWPTQRRQGQFVGSPLMRRNWTVTGECPKECRPPQHQDWRYC